MSLKQETIEIAQKRLTTLVGLEKVLEKSIKEADRSRSDVRLINLMLS